MSQSVCEILPWDSAHFGLTVASVNSSRLTQSSVAEIERWLKADGLVDCLYLRALPEPETMKLAARSGFRFVDARFTLGHAVGGAQHSRSDHVRPTRHEDLAELRRIASESHHDSRFYVDGNFRREACDEMYRIWITKQFEDEGCAVFTAEQDRKAVGYISVNSEQGEGRITLIAVDSHYRGRGLAKQLIHRAELWLHVEGITRVSVPTQAANIVALRLYESCGFRVCKVEPWYHRWPKLER